MADSIRELTFLDHLILKKNDMSSQLTINKILTRVCERGDENDVFQIIPVKTASGVMPRKVLKKDKKKELAGYIAVDEVAIACVDEMIAEERAKEDKTGAGGGRE